MTTAFDPSKEARRESRGRWPIARFRLGEEPLDDLSAVTTVAERIAMMWTLAESAWKVAARPLPEYDRGQAPTRLFPPGTRLDGDDT